MVIAHRYSAIVVPPSRCCLIVGDAIDVIVRRLSVLHPSPEVEALRAQAEEYMREADSWTSCHPVAREKEALMKRLLKLHVEVAKLEREMAWA